MGYTRFNDLASDFPSHPSESQGQPLWPYAGQSDFHDEDMYDIPEPSPIKIIHSEPSAASVEKSSSDSTLAYILYSILVILLLVILYFSVTTKLRLYQITENI